MLSATIAAASLQSVSCRLVAASELRMERRARGLEVAERELPPSSSERPPAGRATQSTDVAERELPPCSSEISI